MDIKIGDIRHETPSVDSTFGLADRGPYRCEVVWIHPARRFYEVRFDFPAGSFCECFWFPEYAGRQCDAPEADELEVSPNQGIPRFRVKRF